MEILYALFDSKSVTIISIVLFLGMLLYKMDIVSNETISNKSLKLAGFRFDQLISRKPYVTTFLG